MADSPSNHPQQPTDWSRRQFLLGMGGVAVAGVAAMFGRSAIGKAVQAMSGPHVDSGLIHVYQGDYYFLPDHLTWRVGDKVSILLHNESPNRFHEMMIGRGFDTTPSIYGPVKTQFHEDFWDNVPVTISQAQGVDNLATNKAIATCDVKPHPWLITAPGNGNFSPTLMPNGYIQLDFVVPNKPGQWKYGCFVQGFRHYEAGMKGTIDILPATSV
jgi:plastocyanin